MNVRATRELDREWISNNSASVGGAQVVSNGVLHTLSNYPGLIGEKDGKPQGFAIYNPTRPKAELIAIAALTQWQGLGSLLLSAVEQACIAAGCRELWLSTTNDNLQGLQFYQRRGFVLTQLRPNAFQEVLAIKGMQTNEPVVGLNGIVIRDELQLTKPLE